MRLSALLSSVVLTSALLGGVAQASTFTVTKAADTADGGCDSDCSLREAVAAAQQMVGEDTIVFAPSTFGTDQTIKLELGEIRVSSDLTINGPTNAKLTLDGQQKSRIFGTLRANVTLNNLIFANGNGVEVVGGDPLEAYGGCINVWEGSLAMDRCVVTGGTAILGGGLLVLRADLDMTNCTVVGNTTSSNSRYPGYGQGGGLNLNNGASATLLNCTITGNRAIGNDAYSGSGGGAGLIAHEPKLFMENCIVAGNTLTPAEGRQGGRDVWATISGNHNIFGDSTGIVGLPGEGDRWDVDPLLEQDSQGQPLLKDNGGHTLTVALRPGSPAIDNGSWKVMKDQRGAPRPTGEGPDIGAYEVDPAPIISSVTLTPTAPLTNDPLTANVTVQDPGSAADAVTLSFRWTRLRGSKTTVLAYTGPTVPTAGTELEAGDIVTVTVTASDGLNTSAPMSAEVTIGNSPVAITELRLTPRAPFTNDRLTATVKATDPDLSRLSYSFVWFHNGEEVRSVKGVRSNQDVLDLRAPGFDKGDLFTVMALVSDGGTQDFRTGTARIVNSAPVISLLTLGPSAPKPTDVVISTFGGRDGDGDTLTRTYLWRIGTKILKEEKGARVDLSKYTFVKPGDVVSVDLQLFDGQAYSKTLTAKVTVAAPVQAASAQVTSAQAVSVQAASAESAPIAAPADTLGLPSSAPSS